MASDNEYFSESDEIQPETINLDDNPREIATVENEVAEHNDQQDKSENKVVKPKKIIRNPLPRFNEQTIRTAKGLPAVLNHFKDVKFKGRGFEEQDLNQLMKIYEYWCHRFYPKFTFEDCIQRFEWLGNKRSTQVYLKKIRMGMEDIFEERISDEKIQTESFVEPFDQLLTTHNDTSEPELTEEQLEQINQNRLRAEAIRRKKMSRINGETSQESNINTVCQNNDNETHNLEMQADEEELGIDNILKMVNENTDSSSSEAVLDVNKEQLYDKKISNAIRRNSISDSEYESNLNNSEVSSLQKENSYKNKEESEGDNTNNSNNSNNSTASSNESTVLHSSRLRKKKSKLIKKINDFQSSFRNKRKISTDSDDDSYSSSQSQYFSTQKKKNCNSDIDDYLSESNLPHKSAITKTECADRESKQTKMVIESDDDSVQRRSQISLIKMGKNRINNIPDSDDEQPAQSNGSINSSIKENHSNITNDDSIKQVNQETHFFLNSDQESSSREFFKKGRLIIDTDESD